MELVVHADDLATSLGVDPPPPSPAAATVSIDTLMATARATHGELSVIRALARGDRSDPGVVRVAGERTSSGGPQELDISGYHCVRTRSEQDPLPQAFYECTNGPKKVTFVRS